jgi:hypothetical protein
MERMEKKEQVHMEGQSFEHIKLTKNRPPSDQFVALHVKIITNK